MCGRGAPEGTLQQQCGLGVGISALRVLGLGCLMVDVLCLLSSLLRFLVEPVLAHSEGVGVTVFASDSDLLVVS